METVRSLKSRLKRARFGAVLWAGLAFVVVLCVTGHSSAEPSRALELEGRLIAPCCYVQTLDIHESELASTLRSEIRSRLARGEEAQAIEDDFARRYGERIRAVPRGRDPRRSIPLVVSTAMALAIGGLVIVGLRWMRRREDAVADSTEPNDAALDAALDAELRRDDS